MSQVSSGEDKNAPFMKLHTVLEQYRICGGNGVQSQGQFMYTLRDLGATGVAC